jgi:glycosyltransferase involved in cell wall biosynthesis
MSTVDVVIPCYNYGRYLRGCVESVLSQAGVNVRVLVIDDASSDDSARVGQELAARNPNVEFRWHEVNKGHIATYNEGLTGWSTSDYAVLLSADDLLAPGSLSRAIRIMEADKDVGMVYGPAIHFQREAELPRVSAVEYDYRRFSGAEWLEARCRAGHNVISSPEVVVRGSIQRAVGGYRPELPHSGDLEMWMRIAAISSIAYVRRIPQAFYRVHAASMLRTKYRSNLLEMEHRRAAFDTFFQQSGHVVTGAETMHDLANRALAREALWDACRAYDCDQLEERSAHELVEFAISTYAKASSLPEYAQLRRRQRLGPVICNSTQLFVLTAVVRKLGRWRSKRRWKRRGI